MSTSKLTACFRFLEKRTVTQLFTIVQILLEEPGTGLCPELDKSRPP